MNIKSVLNIILSLAITLTPLALTSCQESLKIGQEKTIETSHNKAPKWVKYPPKHSRNHFYFVGEDTSYKNTDRYAYQVALAKASSYFNTQVKASFSRLENSENTFNTTVLREELIKNISESAIVGAKHKSTYWEKIEKLSENGIKYFYRVHTLVEFDKKAIKATKEATLEMQINRQSNKKHQQLIQDLKKELMKTYKTEEGENNGK